jgi:hypothetical protein
MLTNQATVKPYSAVLWMLFGAGNLRLDHWNGGRQLEVDHHLDSTIQLVKQGRVLGREHLAEEWNIFFSQLPNGLIDADPLVNRRFSLGVG